MHAPMLLNATSSAPDLLQREGTASLKMCEKRTRPLVFLAEDDADLRRMLSDSLREAGFDVLSASSGHDMLKLLTAASQDAVPVPDALVMDVRMPRCSGLDVLSALRLADWQQPVVMITGFGDPSLHERAASSGASVILDKPVDTDDLVDMLDLLLRLSHAEVMLPWPESKSGPDESAPETMRCPTGEVDIVESPVDLRRHLGRS